MDLHNDTRIIQRTEELVFFQKDLSTNIINGELNRLDYNQLFCTCNRDSLMRVTNVAIDMAIINVSMPALNCEENFSKMLRGGH